MTEPCKHCGACDKCDPCDHCGCCRECGKLVQPRRPVVVPAPYPYYNPYPTWRMYPQPWVPYHEWTYTPSVTGTSIVGSSGPTTDTVWAENVGGFMTRLSGGTEA